MSLIMWEFFWTEADWVQPVIPPRESVGGGSHGNDYHPLTDEYWDTFRKKFTAPLPKPMFEKLAEDEVSPIIASIQQKKQEAFLAEIQAIAYLQTQLEQAQQQQQMLREQMPQAPDIATLKAMAAQLREFEANIPALAAQLQSHIATATRLRDLLRNNS